MHDEGRKIFIRTNHSAPYYKVVTVDLDDPTFKLVDFVAEDNNAPLEDIARINKSNFIAIYKRDVGFQKFCVSPSESEERSRTNFISCRIMGKDFIDWLRTLLDP